MKMTFSKSTSLSEAEQKAKCQQLNPYEEWDLFKAAESEFKNQHGDQPGIARVFCGLGPSVGPINCIVVEIKRGQKRTALTKSFMGFPVCLERASEERETEPMNGPLRFKPAV
ncbi:MAG: hypothetical protein ACYTG0_12000 [Planctomycetota bacterium]|jgi:hypothetical protein